VFGLVRAVLVRFSLVVRTCPYVVRTVFVRGSLVIFAPARKAFGVRANCGGHDFTSVQPVPRIYNAPLQQAPAKAPAESHHCYLPSEDFKAEKSAAEREFPFLGGLTDM